MKKKDSLQKDAPALMAELTQEFVDARDLNSRAKVRARMKAVLDFVSVDTSYPAIGTEAPAGGNMIGFGANPGYDAPATIGAYNAPRGGVLPIPGADNTI